MKAVQRFIVFLMFSAPTCPCLSESFEPWGDMGNNIYCNPVLPADFSDIDCIRVGDDFYAISSTMQFSPGMVILHSRP